MEAQESISILNSLKRNSYDCRFDEEKQTVIVKDPVMSSLFNNQYKEVEIKSYDQCVKFLMVRD